MLGKLFLISVFAVFMSYCLACLSDCVDNRLVRVRIMDNGTVFKNLMTPLENVDSLLTAVRFSMY